MPLPLLVLLLTLLPLQVLLAQPPLVVLLTLLRRHRVQQPARNATTLQKWIATNQSLLGKRQWNSLFFSLCLTLSILYILYLC